MAFEWWLQITFGGYAEEVKVRDERNEETEREREGQEREIRKRLRQMNAVNISKGEGKRATERRRQRLELIGRGAQPLLGYFPAAQG